MRARRKLIVVSNRGPVSYGRDADGGRVRSRGAGGLVTALRGLVQHHDVTWIASALSDEDRVVATEAGGGSFDETTHDGSPYRLRLVAHDAAAFERYYNVVANPTLWFTQHYLWGLGREPDLDRALHAAWSEGYEPANRAFADAVVAELDNEPNAAVFFHDYHLYLAPRFVRTARPGARLAHFVHVPWPQSDYWHVLPGPLRRAVHDGLLANDLVGFHTARWGRAFVESCGAILAADGAAETVIHAGRRTRVTSRAISVDPPEFDAVQSSDAVLAEEEAIARRRPEKLVVRVDRTDPSKNVVRGFRALATLLDEHPEWLGRVTMLALLDPSRQDVPQYAEYVEAIEREARELNERHGRQGWRPVDLQIADNFPQSVAAYKQFDVLLVNAVYDGMNLVAKEAPLVNARDGVLVLSENAGAVEELGEWAITVNPFDVFGQAEALHEALTMDAAERRRRAEAIRAFVREHDVSRWLDGLLADLDALDA